jgi:hypothetical protein
MVWYIPPPPTEQVSVTAEVPPNGSSMPVAVIEAFDFVHAALLNELLYVSKLYMPRLTTGLLPAVLWVAWMPDEPLISLIVIDADMPALFDRNISHALEFPDVPHWYCVGVPVKVNVTGEPPAKTIREPLPDAVNLTYENVSLAPYIGVSLMPSPDGAEVNVRLAPVRTTVDAPVPS